MRVLKKWPVLFIFLSAVIIVFIAGLIASIGYRRPETPAATPNDVAVDIARRISVYVVETDEIVMMPLEEYLIHVTAAEVPARYAVEAIKAQAVAARTFAVQKTENGGCSRGADVCTDSGHCQAFDTESEMREKWGGDYDTYYGIIEAAVAATAGEVMLYDGQPIEVFYHASSGGHTENVENVFQASRPYLISVVSEGEENASNFYGEKTVSVDEFIDAVKRFSGSVRINKRDIGAAIGKITRYDSGRVQSIEIGGTAFTGREVRGMFDLNSANFTVEVSGQTVVFHTVGFGHGVGMSQAGANAMAKAGATYEEILRYYYQGVVVADMNAAD